MMDPQTLSPSKEPRRQWTKGKDLTAQQQQDVVARLLWDELNGNHETPKFCNGVLTVVATEFHVTHFTIRQVWACALQNYKDPTINQFCSKPRKKGNCGCQ